MASATVEDYVKAIYLAQQALEASAAREGVRGGGVGGAKVGAAGGTGGTGGTGGKVGGPGGRRGGKVRGAAESAMGAGGPAVGGASKVGVEEAGGREGMGGAGGAGVVSLGELAQRMRVVPGTATSMVKALSEAGLVKYEPRRGVRLTAGGEKLALHVLRRHRLVELFLVQILKLDWSEVHEEAEALEHALSDKVVDRIDELLGHPKTDPHGDPIPTNAGHIAAARARPLSHCGQGDEVRIVRLDNQDPHFLRYADRHGLLPGAEVTVRTRESESQSFTLIIGGKAVTLGDDAARRIWVSL